MVLRVSRILAAEVPTAEQNCAVSVAMPESRCRKFTATRSAINSERTSPSTSMIAVSALTLVPSARGSVMRNEGSTVRKTSRATAIPATVMT